MPDDWRDVALEDIADELTVGYVGPMATEYVSTGIPFLRSLNVEPLRINKNDLKFIAPEFHRRIQKSRLTPGDVVIVRTGKPGACAVVPDWLADANCSDLVIVRCGKELNNRFLAYYVNTVASGHVAAHIVGAVQQHFNVGSARALRLKLPPLPTQRAIAHILGTLDDKIELNRRMNATLESTARALFQSWFVDFDPVRAKMDGRKPAGMDVTNASIFPRSFSDSSLGHVPENWNVVRLPDAIDFLEGPGLRNWQYRDEGMKFLNIRCIGNGDLDLAKANSISTAEFEKTYSHFALQEHDIVISTSGTLGRLAIVRSDHLPVMLNTSIIRMRGRGAAGLGYLWGFLQSDYFLSEMYALAAGSVQLNFGPMHLRQIMILRPPDSVLEAFEVVVRPLLIMSLQRRKESRTLAALRDTLLPKLLSGELSVKAAESLVGQET